MRIERLRLFEVGLPLVHSFQTSSHRKSGLDHILVEATDAEGGVGWGEIASPADPFYCAETTRTAWIIATEYLAPAVLGRGWEHPDEVDRAYAKVRGHEFAKAGINAAAWDLYSRSRGEFLSAALGGVRDEVAAGVSLGIEPTLAGLVEQVQRQLEAGCHRVKLKIAPGWDVEPVRAVRGAHPAIALHVDANGAYPDAPESTAVFRELDELGLTMIEQPYAPRDLLAHARLQAVVDTPLCLDESVVDLADLQTMLALDAGRVLNIKVSRMGGLSRARQAHDLAVAAGIPVWCGGMHEFGVGRAANVALSSLAGFTLPSDVSGSDKYYVRDVVSPPITAHDGQVSVPMTPGLGHEVDTEWVRAKTLRVFDSATVMT